MEKPARRTNIKVVEALPPEPEVAPKTLSSRGSGRERNFCRQIGFLLVFALCTLFSYYVAVVRLQPPHKDNYVSKPSVIPHAKHLVPRRSSKNEQSEEDVSARAGDGSRRFPFKLPSVDWNRRELSDLIFWGKTNPVPYETVHKPGGVIVAGTDLARAMFDVQEQKAEATRRQDADEDSDEAQNGDGEGAQLLRGQAEGGGFRREGREMGSQSERGLSESDWPGGMPDEEKVKSVEGSGDELNAPMLRGSSRANTTPVLRMVVAELRKQIEKSKLLSDALGLDETAGGNAETALAGSGGGSEKLGGVQAGAQEGKQEGTPKPRKRKRKKFNSPSNLYDPISDEGYHQCVERDTDWPAPPAIEGRGYFYPGLDGGLSQQVFEITNAVAVARILNVTLVIPQLGFDPYWKDGSNFSSVFDLDHFRTTLANDINVITVPELPDNMRNEYFWKIIDRLPYGKEEEYVEKFYDSFSTDKVTKSYSFFTALDAYLRPPLEKLRCRIKYEALRFHPQIVNIAQRLLARMREKARGPFLALHLRFETDMVMYSASCDYGIHEPGELEYWNEQRKVRGWPDPEPDEKMRSEGRCPATPGEVGRWLQAMGFNESTQVYLASGTIYHEDVFMPAFTDMFPNTFTKDDLFTEEEAALLKGKNNILAGIDFEVLTNADVTALTFHGMMKSSISGHRNWLGFRKTLTYPLWEGARLRNLPWKEFKTVVKKATNYGQPMQRNGLEVMGNPVPECMCQY